MSDTPGPGHNSGDDADDHLNPEIILGQLQADHAKLIKRRDDLVAAFARWKSQLPGTGIANEEAAQNAVTFGSQIKALGDAIEAARVQVKRPWDEAVRTVQAFFNTALAGPLAEPMRTLAREVGAFQDRQAEAKRREAEEEAERLRARAEKLETKAVRTGDADLMDAAAATSGRADAAAAVAAAPHSSLAGVKGTFGGAATRKTNWTFRVTDKAALLRAALEGKVPMDFVTSNEVVIGQAVRRAKDPFRPTEEESKVFGIEVTPERSTGFRT